MRRMAGCAVLWLSAHTVIPPFLRIADYRYLMVVEVSLRWTPQLRKLRYLYTQQHIEQFHADTRIMFPIIRSTQSGGWSKATVPIRMLLCTQQTRERPRRLTPFTVETPEGSKAIYNFQCGCYQHMARQLDSGKGTAASGTPGVDCVDLRNSFVGEPSDAWRL